MLDGKDLTPLWVLISGTLVFYLIGVWHFFVRRPIAKRDMLIRDLLAALEDVLAYHDRCSAKGDPVLSPHWEGVVKKAIKKAKQP